MNDAALAGGDVCPVVDAGGVDVGTSAEGGAFVAEDVALGSGSDGCSAAGLTTRCSPATGTRLATQAALATEAGTSLAVNSATSFAACAETGGTTRGLPAGSQPTG